jgi:hypothetical protein
MNGWYDGANVAARERMKDFRRQAEDARNARTAREGRVAEGGVARGRRLAAAALHRLADTLAPRSIPGSEPARGTRDLGGRPVV